MATRNANIPPYWFTEQTPVLGRQSRSMTKVTIRSIIRHYGYRPRYGGSKRVLAWQLRQIAQQLGLRVQDRLDIVNGVARPYVPPAPPRPRPPPPPPPHVPAPAPRKAAGQRPVLETCQICMEDLQINHFPRRFITRTCQHFPTVCLDCFKNYLTHSIENTRWNLTRCPLCPALLPFESVKKYATPEAFERYDRLAALHAVSGDPDFRYCLNPEGCMSGQIHDGGGEKPEMFCMDCGYEMCFTHSTASHDCEQYELEQAQRREEEEANQRYLDANTKICPGPSCGLRIVKSNEMCDHMTCTSCSHQFCWLCLEDYKEIISLGQFARRGHAPTCRYRSAALPNGVMYFPEAAWIGNQLTPEYEGIL